jgi:hypothetical protein
MAVNGADPHAEAAEAVHEHRAVEAQYVRQARRGTRVVWILGISLALAALVTFGFWLARAPDLSRANADNGRPNVPAHVFNAAPPAPKQTAPDNAQSAPQSAPEPTR